MFSYGFCQSEMMTTVTLRAQKWLIKRDSNPKFRHTFRHNYTLLLFMFSCPDVCGCSQRQSRTDASRHCSAESLRLSSAVFPHLFRLTFDSTVDETVLQERGTRSFVLSSCLTRRRCSTCRFLFLCSTSLVSCLCGDLCLG